MAGHETLQYLVDEHMSEKTLQSMLRESVGPNEFTLKMPVALAALDALNTLAQNGRRGIKDWIPDCDID